jgi:hypothetical protein
VRHSPATEAVSRGYCQNRYQETASENKPRKLSMCCSELQRVSISDSAVVVCTRSYELEVVSKPITIPHPVQTQTHDNIN